MQGERLRYYDPNQKRLVYLDRKATPEMWDSLWNINKYNFKKELIKGSKIVEKITTSYLEPEEGIILEGGCGNGRNVMLLKKIGYNVIGIDFAPQTVNMINKLSPDLDIRLGDVRNLMLPDNSVTGYWSLGVIEHFYYGYSDIAIEMARVIKPGGYLFISFPYMSMYRKFKAFFGFYKLYNDSGKEPEDFYQFALNPNSVINELKPHGFELINMYPTSGIIGLWEEMEKLRPLINAMDCYKNKSNIVKICRYLVNNIVKYVSGHSCIMVFRYK